MSHPALEKYPAPWRFGKYGIVAANGESICEIFGRDPGPAEDLMIQSPELYDALEEACNDSEDAAGDCGGNVVDVKKCRAILAKARGENPT